jgi:hypothetical protein
MKVTTRSGKQNLKQLIKQGDGKPNFFSMNKQQIENHLRQISPPQKEQINLQIPDPTPKSDEP